MENRKWFCRCIIVLTGCMLLSGCASNKLKSNDGSTIDTIDTKEIEKQKPSADEINFTKIGSPVSVTLPFKTGAIEYTVENVNLYDNFQKTNINPDDLAISDNLARKYLVLDIKVKNIDITLDKGEDLNIGGTFTLASKRSLDKNSIEPDHYPEISYFSKHQSKNFYFHYVLNPGEEMKCQLGWEIDETVQDLSQLILRVGENIDSKDYIELQ